jgi:hypothetical protein
MEMNAAYVDLNSLNNPTEFLLKIEFTDINF